MNLLCTFYLRKKVANFHLVNQIDMRKFSRLTNADFRPPFEEFKLYLLSRFFLLSSLTSWAHCMIPLPQAAHSHHANAEVVQYVNNTWPLIQPILELLQRKHPKAEHFTTLWTLDRWLPQCIQHVPQSYPKCDATHELLLN